MKNILLFILFFTSLCASVGFSAAAQSPLRIETIFSQQQPEVSLKVTNITPLPIKVPSAEHWNIEWEAWSFTTTATSFDFSTLIAREITIDSSAPRPEQKLRSIINKLDQANAWIVIAPNSSVTLPLHPPIKEAKSLIKGMNSPVDIVFRARVDGILVDFAGRESADLLSSMLAPHKSLRFWFKDGAWGPWNKVKGLR